MKLPQRPAAFITSATTGEIALRRAAAAAARQRGWPVPRIYAAGQDDEDATIRRLAAAIAAGQHDALLMTVPRDPAAIAGLLQACTRHGVAVTFMPALMASQPAAAVLAAPKAAGAVPGEPRPRARAGEATAGPAAAHGESWDVLARARLEALAGLFPDWLIWLDRRGWHARRREAFLQSYRPGAPAFHVRAESAADLAAQLCWQQAADQHAPDGCQASVLPPPPWAHQAAAGLR